MFETDVLFTFLKTPPSSNLIITLIDQLWFFAFGVVLTNLNSTKNIIT
jgi:hypothetical protein